MSTMRQADAAKYKWLGPYTEPSFTPYAYLDDVTVVVTGDFFTHNEFTLVYCEALRTGTLPHGIPVKVHTNRHTIFKAMDGANQAPAELLPAAQ